MAHFTDLAQALFRRKHGRSEQNKQVQALTPHVPAVVTFADHTKPLPWSTKYHSVLMFADISGFTSLCERYSAMEKSGIDELTSTLNGYMGAIVDGILTSDGDVLKYAGDAILAMWRVNIKSELPATLDRVIQCCLDIQGRCGEWDTDVGVKLTVKMGVAAGDMTMTFLGNDEFRHYVELGRVVSDVNRAESFCKSGYVVLSPYAWMQCNSAAYEHEMMDDGAHVRVLEYAPLLVKTSSSEVTKTRERRFSLTGGTARTLQVPKRRISLATSTPSKGDISIQEPTVPEEEPLTLTITNSMAAASARKTGLSTNTMSGVMKLRSVVETVTAMKLEQTLRLYVLSPVLKKLDDNQPLEYLSEMRQVSIVFVNLVLEDEVDNTKLLQQIFDIVFSNIKIVHGCLNKIFLFDKGCTFLVIFGLPGFKQERDCAHALQNSVKMKTILDDLPGIERVSIGVTTGTTFCGVIGHTRRHEYSVIGRKVNMAARLMMHYPDKVTCDDETFQSCRLPPENFVVLVTKRMKGLRNIGIIREFSLPDDNDKDGSELENSIPYFEYPILGREAEKELFLREANNLVGDDTKHRHIMFVGAAGIGKTRLLDTLCNLSVQENIRVISFSLNVHNINMSYFLARHLLKMMLSSCGYSQKVEKEPAIMDTMRLCGMDQHLEAIPELLSTKPIPFENMTPEKCEIRKHVFEFLSSMCLDSLGTTTFIIDDMHYCDNASWDCLLSLSEHTQGLFVLAFRSYAIEQPPCPAAQRMLDEKRSVVKDIFGIDVGLIAALACQCLNVISIPKELDRMLSESSQGVPSWVEQLLRDMYEKRQIFIRYTGLSQNPFRGSVVSPGVHLITKTANIWRTNDKRRPNSSLSFVEVESSPASDKEVNMLAGLGVLNPSQSKVRNTKENRICVMSPGICAKDIEVLDSMKDLVIARIDSMRPTEQLIVKCAAVLDPPFTRQMLEEVLPQASTFKVSTSVKRLFENGTFECCSVSKHQMTPYGRTEERAQRRGECQCPRDDLTGVETVLCNQLRFRHMLLKDTAREMLMGKQKQHLHQKAAEFIEQRVKDKKSNVPYQLFVKCRPEPPSRKKSDSAVDTRSTDERAAQIFRIILKSGEMVPHLPLILDGAVIDNRRNSLLEQLFTEYERIALHYSAADDLYSLIDTQTEATVVAIVLKKNEESLSWLREAKSTFERIKKSSNQPVEVVSNLRNIHAGLERLHGKALHQCGQLHEARQHMNVAAHLLDLTEPANKHATRFQMFRLRLSNFPQFIYFTRGGSVRLLRQASRKRIERVHLLGDLCRLHKDQGKKDLLILDAWRHAANIIGKHVHIHQVLESYIHLIAACRTRGWTDRANRLESELYATCCARNTELLFDDVKALAATLGESALLYLNGGDITKAVDRGRVAATLVGHMAHTRLSVRIYPILGLAYVAADRHEDCIDLLDKLKAVYADLEGWGVDTWSAVIALELMLSPGIPSQTFLMCLKRATTSLKSYDAVIDGCVARYYIAMCIALWYTRKGQWQEAQSWFDYWESYDLGQHNYMTVSAWCKKVECMLLSYCRAIECGQGRVQERIKEILTKEFKKLKRILKSIPGWRPRYFHLRAYFFLLQGKLADTRGALVQCGQQCQKQENALEFRILEHTWREWYRQTTTSNSLNTDWIDQTDHHLLDWRLCVSRGEQVLYALPLPQERVVRRGRWWRSNKVNPQ